MTGNTELEMRKKYGMTNDELLESYSNLSVDDYKELLRELRKLQGVKK